MTTKQYLNTYKAKARKLQNMNIKSYKDIHQMFEAWTNLDKLYETIEYRLKKDMLLALRQANQTNTDEYYNLLLYFLNDK
jgi:hypothetical protein